MRKLVFAAALVLLCQAAFSQAAESTSSLDRPALTSFLQRVVKDKAGAFAVEDLAPEKGKDVFEVDRGAGGKIVLRGSNGVSVASALNYYLKHYCHYLLTWNGKPQPLPAVLPAVTGRVHRRTPYTYRYYLNYCTFNYSMAWWGWERWQREIDWMAMNGINMPLALTGEEAIWQEVYRGLGFTDAELDAFFTGPAFFSWLWMGNIDSWGGPLPAHWKESHKALQKRILAAERAFGMRPVLPAFTGHVPPAFQQRFPGAKVKRTNWDAGFEDVYILDPGDPLFTSIGRKFLEVQTREFGTDHFYSADTFNENVPPTTDSSYLDSMSKQVFASMAAADPKAVWVMQGWMFHYNAAYWQPVQIQALLKAVPDEHMILLDLYSESHPLWNRTQAPGVAGGGGSRAAGSGASEGQTLAERPDRTTFPVKADSGAYYGKPWIWNMLHNFGGNNPLWGRMGAAAADPSAALHDPTSGKMMGIGLTPEGIEQNPALYHLMLENVWRDSAIDVGEWLKEYALERYGKRVAAVDEAWKILEGSVYKGGLGEGGPESIIQARPTFEKKIDRVLTGLDYDPAVLVRALGLFVRSAPELSGSDAFRYDLVDVLRQVLANYASPLQQEVAAAWRAGDTAGYRRSSRQFLALMDDMDRLLATRKEFLLGKWIGDARACGVSPAEKDLYEKNARDLVTLWGDKESGLREYSNRQWSGLIGGFYKRRWEILFARLDKAIGSGAMDWAAFDKYVKEWEWNWVNGHEPYAAEPKGDAVAVVTELYNKYLPLLASNDHIFPAAPQARPFIDFDGKGFLIKGKRCFLASAGLEYARMPHELWRDRLERLQRAGFNCVEIYTFWNFHEPREGVFDFSGDHDLEAFLRLVGEMGMYAIVRVGPYYCAEWDNGGYPIWLRFKEGVRVREDNAEFLKYVDRFFDHLMPIVCRQQIRHGGPVIMVQLENEHNLGWGTAMPNGYFRHLREKALSKGLEVPYFFSGLHHASDPAGEETLDDPLRPNPWFSTEFWSVWYNGYGSGAADSATYARRTWKIIAHGGGGYNYYMAHGGSNFGYTNNDEDAASYDYGAAVGQAGDLRPIYFAFKRAALFARGFQEVLADGVDDTERWKGMVEGDAVRVTARSSRKGTVFFLDNAGKAAVPVEVEGVQLAVAPGEILPVVRNFVVSDRLTLSIAPVRIVGLVGGNALRTLVVEGETGSTVSLRFQAKGRVVVEKGALDVAGGSGAFVSGGRVRVRKVVTAKPEEVIFRVGEERMRVLVVSREMADRTWFVGPEGREAVVCGASYVGSVRETGGVLSMVTEMSRKEEVGATEMSRKGEKGAKLWWYGSKGGEKILQPETRIVSPVLAEDTARLSRWRMRAAGEAALPLFDDRSWTYGERPLQMGADGEVAPNAWYRARVKIDSTGEYTLQLDGGDRATVFVDGVVRAAVDLHAGVVPLRLEKGVHVIAVFTAHDGRDKLAGFMGSMMEADPKGLSGEVRLEGGATVLQRLTAWRFLPASRAAGELLPSDADTGWRRYSIGDDAFDKKEGFGWFRVLLPAPPAGCTSGVLDFRSTDENATVFLNGRRLMRHEGWNIPFRVRLDGLDTVRRPLELTVFIENYSNEGGIDRPVQVHYFSGSKEITGWHMRGGIVEPASTGEWLPAASGRMLAVTGGEVVGVPCYYAAEFQVPRYGERGDHPIYRVGTAGLGHGSVWVNGHNLGRYPEKTPAPGLYIPECWLKPGENELVIYDEDGRRPDSVSVHQESAAGRRLVVYSAGKGVVDWVDPTIGTAKSDVVTKWGNEGGCYPGAVAPWGFVQMTPETKPGGGYDHDDGQIGWFSCYGHMSGYPEGSAGRGKIMPVRDRAGFAPREYLHEDEIARPGYYRVLFRDNQTVVETTASERVGWMRCFFPHGVVPRLYVEGLGEVAALHFSRAVVREEKSGNGRILTFAAVADGPTIVEAAIAISMVSVVNAEANWRAVGEKHLFDEVVRQTTEKWRKVLSVADVEDEKAGDKIIFYTALYHSLLLPWVISDADGRYRGRDGLIHVAKGRAEYGGFSPWDSFRSQQPLLTLLFPGRERDILASMMDVYRETGMLPSDPMTGKHSVAILVDAWLKGVRGAGASELYTAVSEGIETPPFRPGDWGVYSRLGYLPSGSPESVTRTMEYAYDDWALSVFATAMQRQEEAKRLSKAGYRYRNLFDTDSLLFLPREGQHFLERPGTVGYKEGDAWVYTYFVPQHPDDLVRMLGGGAAFTRRLDQALAEGRIVFDNETVFHVPYFFNYSGAPGKTQEWVSRFRDNRFSVSPGGLPGNDDLGAFSSWYIFSSLGFYPFCPGRPAYATGTPLFQMVTLRPENGRTIVVRAPGVDGSRRGVRAVTVGGKPVTGWVLADSLLRSGQAVSFQMGEWPAEEKESLPFVYESLEVSQRRVAPDEPFRVHFRIRNTGESATAIVVLTVDGRVYAQKNCLVPTGAVLTDSMECRLYPLGKRTLAIAGMEQEVVVSGSGGRDAEVTGLVVRPLVWKGDAQELRYSVRNVDGVRHRYIVPIREGGERMLGEDTVELEAGESRVVVRDWVEGEPGVKVVEVGPGKAIYKVYDRAEGALLLSLSLADSLLADHSGFGNRVRKMTEGYVEVANAGSLDELGNTLTMALWVYPEADGEELMDILSKGDHHVLQVKDNKQLSFFAGGWGRGDCTVELPADWYGHWHFIASVCSGKELRLYIDGKLKGSTILTEGVDLSGTNKWTLGRNEEFPGQRIFKGMLDQVRVWAAALSAEEIGRLAKER